MSLILEIFGDRQVSLSREISKKFESVYRGNISNLLPTLENIKGEFVVVVSGYDGSFNEITNLSIIDSVNLYVNEGMEVKEAIKRVAKEKNIPKSEVYREYHVGR
jgi:16S rRNA (cytidine1402-2'-O)-methyltransferase